MTIVIEAPSMWLSDKAAKEQQKLENAKRQIYKTT